MVSLFPLGTVGLKAYFQLSSCMQRSEEYCLVKGLIRARMGAAILRMDSFFFRKPRWKI